MGMIQGIKQSSSLTKDDIATSLEAVDWARQMLLTNLEHASEVSIIITPVIRVFSSVHTTTYTATVRGTYYAGASGPQELS
jgi:hypothetical protein